MKRKRYLLVMFMALYCLACSKSSVNSTSNPQPFKILASSVNGQSASLYYNISNHPLVKVSFSSPVDPSTVNANVFFNQVGSAPVLYTYSLENNDSTLTIQTSSTFLPLTEYAVTITTGLQSQQKVTLNASKTITFFTAIDSTNKFPLITDSQLLDSVQRRTFSYFWEFGHPVSGMARERNTSGDVVTTGGTGFGVMSIVAAVDRNFITRTEGLARVNTIVNFLMNNCTRYHGAFSHWINGVTGATIPFSPDDNGADLVETSYMMEGLLCARQYFNTADANEVNLRANINSLWNGVEWNWFRQGGQNVLYWHWSPDKGFIINAQIKGWNEALIVYALAASSPTDSIPRVVYDNGWASNGGERNGASFYGIQLPLGPSYGGPLFFAHYSFLGINPNSLTDTYANYWNQNVAHSLINYNYCVADPGGYFGYSSSCWGLTASDDNITGYAAHAPYQNDDGVITPTAAISSIPYTPTQSLNALRFFYYKLGDKIWGQYGFMDAFNLSSLWYSNTYLAIDQGPQIVMIENYRSGLLWNLFMSCPEIKKGMKQIGFQSPYLN